MTRISDAGGARNDGVALTLLFGGIALGLLATFALPALHVRDADKVLLGISAWQAAPWMSVVKIVFLAVAAASIFLPRLAPLRLPLTLAAAFMMFLPALSALAAAVHPWTGLRAELAQLSRLQTPWVDPGWGLIALLAAAAMVIAGAMRSSGDEA